MKKLFQFILYLLFLVNNIKAQQPKQDLITIIGSENGIIETEKKYLVLINNKAKKKKLVAISGDAKILFIDNKYYIITSKEGDFLLSVLSRGRALGPPYRFVSIRNKE